MTTDFPERSTRGPDAIDAAMGIALATNMALVAVSPLAPAVLPVAGAVTVVVAALGLVRIRSSQRVLAIVLIVVGVAAYAVAIGMGHPFDLVEALTLNQTLLGMLAAVSFIRIIVRDRHDTPSRLHGAGAVWRTAAATHVLGAAINLSAVNIVGDHLARHGRLSIPNALLLSRAFSAGAFWSPFWAASAAALSYAPGANAGVLTVCGLALALAALLFSIATVVRAYGPDLPAFTGYAVTWPLLRIPLALATLVIGSHLVFPAVDLSVVVLIASLGLTLTVLVITKARLAAKIVGGHIVRGLPTMRGEVTLFTAAGILSVGLQALVDATGLRAPVDEFTVITAWVCAILMIAISLVGVHPVISIAAVAALFAPTNPDPTLFAMSAMIAWGTAAAVGPISGLNVYLAGRYNVNGLVVARRNLPYLGIVTVLALPVLALCAMLS